MGEFAVDVKTVACATSTGAQTITLTTDFGVPKAALFLWSFSQGDGTNSDHGVLGVGATNGTTQWAACVSCENNVGTTDTFSHAQTDECVLIIDPTAESGAVDGEAAFSSFGTDQVVIDWGNAPASGYELTVVAFTGDATEFRCGTGTTSATIGGEATISTGGTKSPQAMILVASESGVDWEPGTAAVEGGRLTMGYGTYDTANIRQCGMGLGWPDGQSKGQTVLHVSSTRALPLPTHDGLALGGSEITRPQYEITGWGASAFGLTTREADTGLNVGFLTIYCGDPALRAYTEVWDVPSGTGTKTYNLPASEADFEPLFLLWGMTRMNTGSENRNLTTALAGTAGWSCVATVGEGHAQSAQNQRNSDPTDCQSLYTSRVLHLPPHTGGTAGHRGDHTAWTSDGFTINVTNSVTSTKPFPLLLLPNPPEVVAEPRAGEPRGQTALSGSVAGATAATGAVTGRSSVSGPVMGMQAMTGSVAGRVVTGGAEAGYVGIDGS